MRNRAAENLVNEFEASAARQRLEDALAITELAATTCLLLVATLDFDASLDRLAVRHFGLMQFDFDMVTAFEFRDCRLNVLLTGTTQLKLLGLVVAVVTQQRVFVEQLMNSA